MSIKARFSLNLGEFALAVDLTLPAGGVTAVFGPSGCGKTTLLRVLAGLEKCPGGFLQVGPQIWQDDQRFVPPHRRALGYVFQEASLFAHLDVAGNLAYGARRVPAGERRVSVDRAVALLGIEHLLARSCGELSGGERQRVAIARALAASPGLLLMDEPLAGLDVARRQEILPYLESLRAELDIPVIYVSHAPEEVARLADHLVLMDAGRVQADGPITEMLTRLDLPLGRDDEAAALITASVAAHDETYALTSLEFPGGRFSVARQDLPVGRAVRLRVAARDVSLTEVHQAGTSILNIFPAEVVELATVSEAQVMVRLSVGGVPLLSRITRKSAALLDLSCGKPVYAQVKSVALLS